MNVTREDVTTQQHNNTVILHSLQIVTLQLDDIRCPTFQSDARDRAVVRMARARWAEDLVASFYQRDGYEIVARNWHCREGELDIVAVLREAQVKTIVVVEVRARASNYFGSALESVTPAKQKKLRIATKKFLASQTVSYSAVRFDVASVMGVKVEIVRDAF